MPASMVLWHSRVRRTLHGSIPVADGVLIGIGWQSEVYIGLIAILNFDPDDSNERRCLSSRHPAHCPSLNPPPSHGPSRRVRPTAYGCNHDNIAKDGNPYYSNAMLLPL